MALGSRAGGSTEITAQHPLPPAAPAHSVLCVVLRAAPASRHRPGL